jgi:hypothetical protein
MKEEVISSWIWWTWIEPEPIEEADVVVGGGVAGGGVSVAMRWGVLPQFDRLGKPRVEMYRLETPQLM